MTAWARARPGLEVPLSALLAAFSTVVVVALAPPAIDAPAHLYRTFLVERGVHLWDNLWFAGQYPLASYSFLYYLPAALVGNVPLVAAAVVASAALFASILVREWGSAGRWPSLAFGLLAAGPLVTGTYSYAVGLACLLGALRALQSGGTGLAVALAALTLGLSPLAFLFLCLILLAVLLGRRRLGERTLALAGGLAALAVLELAVLAAFPSDGAYPFTVLNLLGVLAASGFGIALSLRARHGGAALAAFFALWGAVCMLAFLVPTPIGSNLTRLRSFVFPLALLLVLLAGGRPRALALAGLALGFAYNVVPYATTLARAEDGRGSHASYWTPALGYLRAHSSPAFRVEVVPTFDHWEAYFVPRAGFSLARGWYRQLDIARNPALYRETLSPEGYRTWLRRLGIRHVLLPRLRLDQLGARREAALLRSGRSGLRPVFTTRDWTVFELPRPTPILTGPAGAGLTALDHERITGWVAAPGRYLLRVRYSPWQTESRGLCVRPAPGGMTVLEARRAGGFVLRAALRRGDGGC